MRQRLGQRDIQTETETVTDRLRQRETFRARQRPRLRPTFRLRQRGIQSETDIQTETERHSD